MSFFNGDSRLLADRIMTYTYQLDADVYGDGNVSSTYIGALTAAGPVTTLHFTLESLSIQCDPGAIIDLILIDAAAVPEPSTAVLASLGLAGAFAWSRRVRVKSRN